MKTLEGMLDLGFALVRGKIRLGISNIGVGKWTYEKVQLGEKKKTPFTHSGTGTKMLLPLCLGWYQYQ